MSILTDLTTITTPDDLDLTMVVDVSDTTMDATGTNKKLSWSNIKATLKSYFDSLYQDELVSGTNIKTINSQSILGSGDITISGGTGDVTGAASSVDGNIVLFNGTTGKVIKDAGISLSAKQDALGYTAENVSNKSTSTSLGSSDTLYPSQNAVKTYVDTNFTYHSAGAITLPTYTDLGTGSITIPNLDVALYDNSINSGVPKKYTLTGNTFALTDGVTNYVVANYNSGSPVIQVSTDVNIITESDIVPLFTIYREGTTLHSIDWDRLGLGLSNKLHQSIVKTERYRRESGLAISESGTRNIDLTAGVVWTGAVRNSLTAIASATDNIRFYSHVAGVWTESIVTQYNNTQYDNGTNLVTLTNGRYAVNWLYRGVESQKHLYMVLGTGDFTLAQAQASQPPATLPADISSHAVLVGRIIVLKNAATSTQIDSAFSVTFTQSSASIHNDLSGLQGGSAGEYYHLTSAQATVVGNTSGTNTGDETTSRINNLYGTTNAFTAGSIELGAASDTTITRSSAGVIAVEGVTVPLNSTSATHTAGTIELGAASDTTLSRASAGQLAVEGVNVLMNGGALGTPSSGTLTNCSGLPVTGIAASTSSAIGVGSIELGHASDTTIARSSAGVISVEGVVIPSISSTNTLTNKSITKRVASTTDSATATINCDSYDEYYLTAIANNTTISISGTPTTGQTIFVGLKDAGVSKTLTWTSITGLGQTLPTATTAGKQHIIGLKYLNSAWRAIAVNVEA